MEMRPQHWLTISLTILYGLLLPMLWPASLDAAPLATASRTATVSASTSTCPSAFGWRAVSSPNPGTADNEIHGLAAISSHDVWAVGWQQTVTDIHTLAEHWNGTAWSTVATPNVGLGPGYLLSASAVSANDVWAVGDYPGASTGLSLTEHWNGNTWAVVPSPNVNAAQSTVLRGVAAISANDVWAVGFAYFSNSTYKSLIVHWDGSAWNSIPAPSTGFSTGDGLNGISALAANDIWVAGFRGAQSGLTLTEHWDGSTWSIVPSPNVGGSNNTFTSISAGSSTNIWAVGYYYSSTAAQLKTLTQHWNGTAWSIITSPNPNLGQGDNALYGVVVAANGGAWAVGQMMSNTGVEAPLVAQWNGATWTLNTNILATTYSLLYTVAASASTDVWAAGFYNAPSTRLTLMAHYPSLVLAPLFSSRFACR